jgi:hypothetical protein
MNKKLPSSLLCFALTLATAAPEIPTPSQVEEPGCNAATLCSPVERTALHEQPWTADHAPPEDWNSALTAVSGTASTQVSTAATAAASSGRALGTITPGPASML